LAHAVPFPKCLPFYLGIEALQRSWHMRCLFRNVCFFQVWALQRRFDVGMPKHFLYRKEMQTVLAVRGAKRGAFQCGRIPPGEYSSWKKSRQETKWLKPST